MGKLHQALAPLDEKKKQAANGLSDTARVFGKAGDYFSGFVKVTTAHDEARAKEMNGTEHKAMVTTVPAKLKHTAGMLTALIDLQATIDKANQSAVADLIVDGQTLLTGVTSVTLLAIEREFKKFLEIVKQAPTNTIGIEWVPAPDLGEGMWKSKHDQVAKKHEQTIVGIVLSPATDKFPAQIDKLSKQVPVADITTTLFSGALTSADKADICERLQKIIDAAKEAVTRANDVDAPVQHLGDKLFKFVLG